MNKYILLNDIPQTVVEFCDICGRLEDTVENKGVFICVECINKKGDKYIEKYCELNGVK